jgi:aminoglycoside phosphotransferase (APT) family kinase protein
MSRRTYIETGIARALDARKRRLASSRPPYSPPSLDEISDRLQVMIGARLGGGFRVANLQHLTGGASKQHFVFDLEGPAAGGASRRSLVLRTALSECLGTAPAMEREAEVQLALRGVVPVAEVVCADPQGEHFGAPAIVLERIEGSTVPPEAAGKPSGFGSAFSPERRAALGPQFVENLARIHAFAATDAGRRLAAFERPAEGTTEATDWGVSWWRRSWEDDALEDHPMIEVALDWLEENAPVTERIALVHGDYRAGNFLFDPKANRMTAVLDWEMTRLGDRHEDLGWTLARIYTVTDVDGTELVCGLVPRDKFLRRYEELSGLPVDRERLFYYEVFNELKIAVIALGTGPRNAHDRQSHAHLSNLVFLPAGYRCTARLHDLLRSRLG